MAAGTRVAGSVFSDVQQGQQLVSNTTDGCLNCRAIGSFFLLLGKMKALSLKILDLIQMWDWSIFVEWQSRSTQACTP